MRFAALHYTVLFLSLPLLALFFWLARRRTLALLRALADRHLAEQLTQQVSDRKAILRGALLFVAMFLIVAALVRPQMGGRSTLVKREGIDLLFALDVSKSMLVQDIRPSRLKRASLELELLLEQLSGDRVGIVSFAGASFVQCPLTSDYAAARMFLKSLAPEQMPVQGTAIGDALQQSLKVLSGEKTDAGARLIVLMTDGEDHGEDLDAALTALDEAKVPVFVVGIGSPSGEPIPQFNQDGSMAGYLRDKAGKTVMSRLDERLLRKIADKTGGRYINLQAGGTLEELREYVKRMQKQEFESSLYTQYDELYPYLLWPALLLLLIAAFIDERRGSRWLGVRS